MGECDSTRDGSFTWTNADSRRDLMAVIPYPSAAPKAPPPGGKKVSPVQSAHRPSGLGAKRTKLTDHIGSRQACRPGRRWWRRWTSQRSWRGTVLVCVPTTVCTRDWWTGETAACSGQPTYPRSDVYDSRSGTASSPCVDGESRRATPDNSSVLSGPSQLNPVQPSPSLSIPVHPSKSLCTRVLRHRFVSLDKADSVVQTRPLPQV
jgi:hypothetical protein